MDMVLRMFQKFVPAEEAEMKAVVLSGENAALDDPESARKILNNPATVKKILGDPEKAKKILEMESKADDSSGATGSQSGSSDVGDLLRDIHEDPDIAIKRNAELFDQKFAIQRRKIQADIARSVRREGDRIISAVTAGPHDRIIDKVSMISQISAFLRCRCLGYFRDLERHGLCHLMFLLDRYLQDTRDGKGAQNPDILYWLCGITIMRWFTTALTKKR
jgi:hypothetical protein